MKKLLAVLLVLSVMLSLCACMFDRRDDQYDHIIQMLENEDFTGAIDAIRQLPGYPTEPIVPDSPTEPGDGVSVNEPTEEERDMLEAYASILQNCHHGDFRFWEDGSYLYGSAAMERYYAQLQGMAAIDKWLENPDDTAVHYYFDSDYFCDRQTLMSRFTVLEDVYLGFVKTYEDNMGNLSGNDYSLALTYDPSGICTEEYGESIELIPESLITTWRRQYTYDDAGRLAARTYFMGDNSIQAIITYTYDDQNRIQSAHWKENSGESDFAYTYDASGKLTGISGTRDGVVYAFSYRYDDAGRQVYAEYTRNGTKQCSYTYEFDSSGNPVGAVCEVPNSDVMRYYGDFFHYDIGTHTYTLDDRGRVIRNEIIPDVDYYAKITFDYFYGDYYFYSEE